MKQEFGHLVRKRDSAVMRKRRSAIRTGGLGAGVLVAIAVLSQPSEVEACGACYASSSESTVVNDHKMAFAIQKQRTILWDQIAYSGNPREFAYVIPAKPGTKLEPSTSAWFSALDTSTRPIIMQPQSSYGGFGDDSSGPGCCSAFSTSADSAFAGSAGPTRETVQIVDQALVGPYETVTIRSQDSNALQAWLVDHGYAVPASSAPIIASYVAGGLDFIAMRLQPGKDTRAMEPIRIVSPGTDTSLPLRMMQIGAGAKVGITLYVIGEGRYHSASFPDAPIDFDKLLWDYGQTRSNYQELSLAAMAGHGGRGFITEYADRPSFATNQPPPASGAASNQGLASAYQAACTATGNLWPRVPVDASGEPGPSNDDAGLGDGGARDASDDGALATPDAGPRPAVEAACDDLDVATSGMAINDVWVTRLRANLPNAALADTLRLEPAPKQEKLDNVHQTTASGTIPTARVARLRESRAQGTYALIALTALIITRVMRRKPKAVGG